MTRLSVSSQKLFWAKVNKSSGACWFWTVALHGSGYGIFGIGKTTYRAHRISWTLKRGPIPKGLFVLHKCDVRACVNPSHLFLGTNQDNVNDMIRKGRNSAPPSMGGWNRKEFSKEHVRLLGKVPDTEIAKMASCSKYAVQRVRRDLGIPALPSQTRFSKGSPHPRWGKKGESFARS